MKIGILAWDKEEEESLDLVQMAHKMGHSSTLFTLEDITASWNGRVEVGISGCCIEELDVIISRTALRSKHWQLDTEKFMLLDNVKNVPIVDRASAFIPAKSKLLMMQKLSQAGLAVPPTTLCSSLEAIQSLWFTYDQQIVIKPSYGYGGADIQRIDDFDKQQRDISHLLTTYDHVLIQPYLAHPQGDMRVTVIGQDVGSSFRRVPRAQDWKTNVALGAHAIPYEPTAQVRDIALKAANVMGVTIAGIDIIEFGNQYIIFEVNTCPGWYPLPAPQKEEAAAKVIRHAVARATEPVMTIPTC